MATFTRPDVFTYNVLVTKTINFNGDSFRWTLSNTAPVAASTNLLSNITQIATSGGFTQAADGGVGGIGTATITAIATTGGQSVNWVQSNTITLTATGAVGPFQYIFLFDDTPTSPLNPVMGWLNHGSAVTMANTDTYTIPAATLLTIG